MEPGNCFGYNIMVSCQTAEVGSRLQTGGEKQDKSQEKKKIRKNIGFCERGFIYSAGFIQLRNASLLFTLTIL